MPNPIQIIAEDQGLTLQERPIQISDERLNTILKEVYERARKDERGVRWYDYYGVAWSSFFTLLVALLSQFFTIDFSVEKWGGCQWVFVFECIVDIGLLVWAIASTMVRMAKKLSDMMSERDAAVAECLNRHYNSAAKV